MKPAGFEYFAPDTIEEALALLSDPEREAKILAGGQSLLPMMNFRLASPDALVDLNRISALSFIDERDATVEVGAMTRQRAIEFSPTIARRLPLLQEAVKLVGHLPTRTRGTIGGSLVQADPSAELPLIVCLLDAEIITRGPDGERTIKASEFFHSLMTTTLASDEILMKIRFPVMSPHAGFAVEEFARRSGDFAIASVAALVDQTPQSRARCEVRLAVGGVGPIPMRLHGVENLLKKNGLDDNTIAEACKLASQDVDPMADQNASTAYRRHLTSVLLDRALRKAISRGR